MGFDEIKARWTRRQFWLMLFCLKRRRKREWQRLKRSRASNPRGAGGGDGKRTMSLREARPFLGLRSN